MIILFYGHFRNLQSEPLSSTHDLDGASGVSLTLKNMTDQQQWSNIAAESDINVGDQLALVFESDGSKRDVGSRINFLQQQYKPFAKQCVDCYN